jgi:hypothetical protein
MENNIYTKSYTTDVSGMNKKRLKCINTKRNIVGGVIPITFYIAKRSSGHEYLFQKLFCMH